MAGWDASLYIAALIESLSVYIYPILQHSSLQFERLIRREGNSEYDFLAQEYVGLLGSDLIVNDSGIGAIRGYGRAIKGWACLRQAAAIEIESGKAFDNDVYTVSCYDGLGRWS